MTFGLNVTGNGTARLRRLDTAAPAPLLEAVQLERALLAVLTPRNVSIGPVSLTQLSDGLYLAQFFCEPLRSDVGAPAASPAVEVVAAFSSGSVATALRQELGLDSDGAAVSLLLETAWRSRRPVGTCGAIAALGCGPRLSHKPRGEAAPLHHLPCTPHACLTTHAPRPNCPTAAGASWRDHSERSITAPPDSAASAPTAEPAAANSATP